MRLETAVRDAAWAMREVYVVTGPTNDPNEEQMQLPGTDESHSVPAGYFKVVANGSGRLTAFFFDQDVARDMNHCDGIVTLEDVESASGLDLFSRATNWPNGSLRAELGC